MVRWNAPAREVFLSSAGEGHLVMSRFWLMNTGYVVAVRAA